MVEDLGTFVWLLSVIWFVFYWLFGGVLFAAVALTRFGRVRKVRFSCLFTALAAIMGHASARIGMTLAEESQQECLAAAKTQAEAITAIFGCGAVGVFGIFLFGAVLLALGGFLIMAISTSKNKPWIRFDETKEGEEGSPKGG